MRTRVIALVELAQILPAALFMGALVVREFGPAQYEPARAAQQVIMWYAERMWALWALLLALPFTAFATGCATVWREEKLAEGPSATARQLLAAVGARLESALVPALTAAAGIILMIVVLHMGAD